MATQTRMPNPFVWCQPGWCLAYVKDAFGTEAVYPSATAAWNASPTKHRDWDFPSGVAVPVWFHMPTEPLGHVALRMPDGSVYSTSDPINRAKHHPNMQHLLDYYAYYGMPLNYLGWTEDVEGQTVITLEEQMNAEQDAMLRRVHDRLFGRDVQRWFNPDTMEVRGEPFDGSIPARSTDIHDVMSSNNWLAANVTRILDAVANVPGIDSAIIKQLGDELSAELAERTSKLKVVLTNAE